MGEIIVSSKDEVFLDAYCNPDSPLFGKVNESLLKAEFSIGYRSQLLRRLSDKIIERAKTIYSSNSIKAAKFNVGVLDGTEDLSSEFDIKKAKLRSEIAQDIMDRVGISKKQEVSVESTQAAIVFLPSKQYVPKELLPIDAEYEEVTP